ncbi:uncharacterized protein LOC114515809 [Dendronephthya gigantea]|uniref:uncharacterized protein LOC114515809 n=1 Tax=Dendronephthya gigantea TaxID=151771 RepID=UPI0010696926|nr:uncharacterized protein LOC114515809 [Dendronephthya gigantea]
MTIVWTVTLGLLVLQVNLFGLAQMNVIDPKSQVQIHGLDGTSLKVEFTSSESQSVVEGGTNINFNITISYDSATIHSGVDEKRQSEFNEYCKYVEELRGTVLYRGGDTFLNCTNVTRLVESNYTCNSTDGINCILNATDISPSIFGNWSLLNVTNSTLNSSSLQNNARNLTEILKTVYRNVTSVVCVNSTTPLVAYKPTIQPPGYFNLTYQTVEIDIVLPREFDINSVESLKLMHDFKNSSKNCTSYIVNSTIDAEMPNVTLRVQLANISWSGSMIIHSSVSERVIPKQLLNATGRVKFAGEDKELWIGSYTVPGLQYKSFHYLSPSFGQTPLTLLTDEEEITVKAKFVLPSVTTEVKVFVQFPVYNGTIPLKITSASVENMHSNVHSPNLRPGSSVGSNIVLTNPVSLNPSAPTLVTFKFGTTVTSPGDAEKGVFLQVKGLVDSTSRYDVYVPGTFGNITSWLVYSTALGDETIQSPQRVETELGQPQVKYQMKFERGDGNIEGGLEITNLFEFYNPSFATEGAEVRFQVSFASSYMDLVSYEVRVCNVSVDTPDHCQNISLWPLLTISNTSTSLLVEITNLTAGFGVFGKAVGIILPTVPASERLLNQAELDYQRERWSKVSDSINPEIITREVSVSSQVVSSSVATTSRTDAAVGEEFKCHIAGIIPVTSNRDFAIVVGSDASVSYGQGSLVHVGENLAGDGFRQGIVLNITSGITPYIGASPAFFGQFGTVTNNGRSTSADASTFIIEVTLLVKKISANTNGKIIRLTSTVHHNPGNRIYNSVIGLKVVEPSFTASVVVSPSKDVNQDVEMSFVATIKRSSTSRSTAFNTILLLSIPAPHFTVTEYTSQTGTLKTVPGSQSPVQFLSPSDINSTVIVYENDAISQSSVEIRYKARTSSTLPASIFIVPSFVMSYTSLPKNLNQSLAREYQYGRKSQPTILTFRPDPFLSFSFHSHNQEKFDAGDVLNFTIAVKNIGVGNVKPIAYTVRVELPLSKTTFKDSSFNCNQGSITASSDSQVKTYLVQSGTFVYGEEIRCDLKTTLNTVTPAQKIKLSPRLSYHCLPTANQNEYEGYTSRDKSEIFIKELSMQLTANGDTSNVLCNDVLEYNLRIVLPEVTTNLRVEYKIPTIASNARGKRSTRGKRASQINTLQPNSSQTSYTNGANLVVSSMTNSLVGTTYTVEFPTITNQPDNIDSEKDVLTVKVKFQVANEPVIFSGRNFDIVSTVFYPGGSVSQTATFYVVGPLVKPLLQLAKSYQVLDTSLDSPSGIFYVNVSHTTSSKYDAYDVNITDFIEGMNVIRDKEFPGIEISALKSNTYQLSSNIPVIKVGETVHFYYKSKFKVEVKTPKYIRKTASVTWRSPQLNSPAYGPEINSDACVGRNDTDKERRDPLYRFLALGAFIGLLVGFLTIIISVCIFIKCCRKGRLVPYYRILAGKPTYTALQEEECEEKPFTAPANSSVDQNESVVYIISFNDPKKTENELESLDMQTTKGLDRQMENSRQTMFMTVFERILKNLRTKRDISEDQMKMYTKKMHARLDEISARNRQEYTKRSEDLQKNMQQKGELEMQKLDERRQREVEEAKTKLDGADKKKTKEVLSLIVAHYQTLENDVRAQIKLEHDVEMEKIRKELSINSRLSSKEAQGSLLKEMIQEAQINEAEAEVIVSEHLEAVAAVEKIHDDEKSRHNMALEMRREERKALAEEMREQEEQEAQVLATIKEKYDNALENLVSSSQVSEEEATAYREKLMKDVETLDKKLEKQRSRQEESLHDRLSLLKKKKLQEKEDGYKLAVKNIEETNNDSESPKDVILARQKLTQKYNEEVHELERELDRNAAEDLKELRSQYAEQTRGEYKNKIEKYYKELMKKGAMQEDYQQLLDSHDQDVARILVNQQAEQNKQKIALDEKLKRRRELLTEKMKAEQKEQEQIRNEEQKVLKNMIDNQVVISEEEKEKILREHEQNMAELESSLTLSKLRQKQMLEEKLEKRRAKKMEKLQQKHENENKRIKIENVEGATEEVDLLKKQEMEKQQLIENDANMENEIEQIREEMLNARMEALQEHNDRLGALISDLQIKRASQIAEINKQQRALSQLQTSILDDLDEKGVLVDPETKAILQQHQEQSQNLEKVLKDQRNQQEKALKERLSEKLKQKEQRLMQEQKDEIGKYIESHESSNAVMRFRKAALKARHKAQLDQERQQIEKEIEQSMNELKMQLELNRLKAVEKQNIQFISALVKCGKIQEEELDSVLQVLFPAKKPEEIDELLAQIYGPAHTKTSALALHSSKPSSLELKVIAQISPMPSSKRKVKPRFEKPDDLNDLPPPEVASDLPPVILQGSKGFNLQNSLKSDRSKNKTDGSKPLGRVRLAPLDKNL